MKLATLLAKTSQGIGNLFDNDEETKFLTAFRDGRTGARAPNPGTITSQPLETPPVQFGPETEQRLAGMVNHQSSPLGAGVGSAPDMAPQTFGAKHPFLSALGRGAKQFVATSPDGVTFSDRLAMAG